MRQIAVTKIYSDSEKINESIMGVKAQGISECTNMSSTISETSIRSPRHIQEKETVVKKVSCYTCNIAVRAT